MRIALLGFSIECNRFAPVATEADFASRTLLSGQAMLDEARSAAPHHPIRGLAPGALPRIQYREGTDPAGLAAGPRLSREHRAEHPMVPLKS